MKALSMTSIVIVTILVHFVVGNIMEYMKNGTTDEASTVNTTYRIEPKDSINNFKYIVQ